VPRFPKITLPPLPGSFAESRVGLHRVAELVVAPARKPDNEISLRATDGGFGTPGFEFGLERRRVRVQAAELVYERGDQVLRTKIGSLAQAGELVDDLLPAGTELDGTPLAIDPEAATALGAWYALGQAALEALIAEAGSGDAPTNPLLWPEHFDLAIESGSESTGRRANYGFSPGDDDHSEPYLYVGPWRSEVSGDLWNATGFSGAELGYAELQASEDPLATALDFCRERRQALDSMETPTEGRG
jgi:hypothetical protein